MAYQVVLSRRAVQDLKSIVRYISLDSPSNAKSFGELLLTKANSLSKFTKVGKKIQELRDSEFVKSSSSATGLSTESIMPDRLWKYLDSGMQHVWRQK
tara:strand:- start:1229 stop:1522 length:294 start_codon:yes stop_codon:yes gene_type:complete